jgi:hypothetical protein
MEKIKDFLKKIFLLSKKISKRFSPLLFEVKIVLEI